MGASTSPAHCTNSFDSTLPMISRPVAVLSYNRPQLLKAFLESLKEQSVPVDPQNIALFQDNGDAANDECILIFKEAFPNGNVFATENNLGVALNMDRAERHIFEVLGADAGYFFEDDLILGPHYITALNQLAAFALKDERIGYVAAYGCHTASLEEQKRRRHDLVPMSHKWGFALTRSHWWRQRDIIEPYLDIVRQRPYRERDHAAIQAYFRKLGYPLAATSQDAAKDVATFVLGATKIMSFACFGKYEGREGVHFTPEAYQLLGYDKTEVLNEPPLFVMPSSLQLDNWISLSSATRNGVDMTQQDSTDFFETGVDERIVVACYRALLGREPESALIIEEHIQAKHTLESLLKACLQSSEFAGRKIEEEPVHAGPKVREKMEIDTSGSATEMKKLFKHMESVWSKYGKEDPYYSVLTNEIFKKSNINKKNVEEFYHSSNSDFDFINSALKRNYIELKKDSTVLDFGCGLGRVGLRFVENDHPYIGVDISRPHLTQAEKYFSEMNFKNYEFILLEKFFQQTEIADLVFSLIVLQHNPPPVIALLIEQMCDALRPGGTLIFQVPTRLNGYRFNTSDYVSNPPNHGVMEMHAFPQKEIFKILRNHKCTPVEVFEADMIGPIGESTIFVAVKDSKPELAMPSSEQIDDWITKSRTDMIAEAEKRSVALSSPSAAKYPDPAPSTVQRKWSSTEIALFPHMEDEGRSLVEERLISANCFLEYGAGGSTVMAAILGVPTIISVESDADYLAATEEAVKANGQNTTFYAHHADIGPTGEWGKPIDRSKIDHWPRYAGSVWSRIESEKLPQPDVVLIDGRFRVASVLATMLMAKQGTRILFDDYYDRPFYHIIEKYLRPQGRAGRMAEFVVPRQSLERTAIADLLAMSTDFN
jgi:SAM-dependent methyltransferase